MSRIGLQGLLVALLVSAVAVGLARADVVKVEEFAFNRGEEMRLPLADLSVLARSPDAKVWKFEGEDWLHKDRPGTLISLEDLQDVFPTRRLAEVVEAFRVDMNGDGMVEILLAVRNARASGPQFGLTILTQKKQSLDLIYRPTELMGERYQVMDIRDHDGDGRPEVIVKGEGGVGDFYAYYCVLAFDEAGSLHKRILAAPETLHLTDLNEDGKLEFLVRKVVSRRGERPLYWTLVDQVVRWDGREFDEEPEEFLGYHDRITKKRLIDELLDFYKKDLLLLETKAEVIRQVHGHVTRGRPIEVVRDSVVALARAALRKKLKKRARTLLNRALRDDPYRVDALFELGKLEMWAGRERAGIEFLYRALGVKPTRAPLWLTLGFCFSRVGEETSAISAMVNSVRLSDEPSARLEKLGRLAETYRNKGVRKAIEAAYAEAKELVAKDLLEMDGVNPAPGEE